MDQTCRAGSLEPHPDSCAAAIERSSASRCWLFAERQVRGHPEANHCRTKSSFHSRRLISLPCLLSARSHREATMDVAWCFMFGLMAGFLPCFAVLALIVLRAV